MTFFTEQEAAEKWCPLAVNSLQVRDGAERALPGCIGSRCMAWRSAGKPIEMIGQSLVVRIPDEREDRGYCGAFGKIEP